MKVLFCDDSSDECQHAVDAALEGSSGKIECAMLHSDKLKDALVEFFKAFDNSLKGEKWTTAFDDFDIVVIDNNLSHLKMPGTRLTAEAIAGYIRAISNTPYVISLNMNTEVDFDLRYLVGDFTTKADLAINVDHLKNPALWSGSQGDGSFNPWYWPTLLEVPQRRRKQIEFVAKNIDASVLDALGFPEAAIHLLSRHAKGALSPEAQDEKGSEKPVASVSFRDFFRSSPRSIPAREDRDVFSGNNILPIITKVVAAELDGWFRRDVLGPQDVLVDVPHLILRMPFLLANDPVDLANWNATTNAISPPFGLSKTLFQEHLQAHLFRVDCWLPSPAFWWPPLKANTKLNDLFLNSDTEWGDYVFCEDTSTFVSRTGAESEPLEFAAEYDGAWNRRYIARLKNFKYAPRSRLAM